MRDGIDYFPLDVQVDDKFELIEAESGLTGFAVVVKLLPKMNGGFGYYFEWTNDSVLLFGGKVGLDGHDVYGIVRDEIKRGVFDED